MLRLENIMGASLAPLETCGFLMTSGENIGFILNKLLKLSESLWFSGDFKEIEVNLFAQIHLILEMKFVDDHFYLEIIYESLRANVHYIPHSGNFISSQSIFYF